MTVSLTETIASRPADRGRTCLFSQKRKFFKLLVMSDRGRSVINMRLSYANSYRWKKQFSIFTGGGRQGRSTIVNNFGGGLCR